MKMNEIEDEGPVWDLKEWEEALTLKVGSAFSCRNCGNIVMVSKGGVGVLDLVCCGNHMTEMNEKCSGANS